MRLEDYSQRLKVNPGVRGRPPCLVKTRLRYYSPLEAVNSDLEHYVVCACIPASVHLSVRPFACPSIRLSVLSSLSVCLCATWPSGPVSGSDLTLPFPLLLPLLCNALPPHATDRQANSTLNTALLSFFPALQVAVKMALGS